MRVRVTLLVCVAVGGGGCGELPEEVSLPEPLEPRSVELPPLAPPLTFSESTLMRCGTVTPIVSGSRELRADAFAPGAVREWAGPRWVERSGAGLVLHGEGDEPVVLAGASAAHFDASGDRLVARVAEDAVVYEQGREVWRVEGVPEGAVQLAPDGRMVLVEHAGDVLHAVVGRDRALRHDDLPVYVRPGDDGAEPEAFFVGLDGGWHGDRGGRIAGRGAAAARVVFQHGSVLFVERAGRIELWPEEGLTKDAEPEGACDMGRALAVPQPRSAGDRALAMLDGFFWSETGRVHGGRLLWHRPGLAIAIGAEGVRATSLLDGTLREGVELPAMPHFARAGGAGAWVICGEGQRHSCNVQTGAMNEWPAPANAVDARGHALYLGDEGPVWVPVGGPLPPPPMEP